MKLTSKLSGYYKIEVEKPNGERRVLADWFPNLITNNGLDMIGIDGEYLRSCQVGAGATAPAFTDTTLASYLAYSNSLAITNGNSGSSPYYSWQTFVYTFNTGVAAGNLTEVGVSSSTSGNLFSRALILNGGGSPTPITVLSDEVLYVTYQFRRYIPEVDTSGTVTIDGVDYDFVGRASSCTSLVYWPALFDFDLNPNNLNAYTYNGSIGLITGAPSGPSGTTTSTKTISAYSTTSYATEWKWSFSLSQGNASGGISALSCGIGGGRYQFSFSPAIPKTSDKIMTLTFTTSWARA